MSRIYGRHAVEELLDRHPAAIAAVVVATQRLRSEDEALVARVRSAGIPVREVDAAELKRRSGGRGAVRLGCDVRVATIDGIEALGAPGPADPVLVLALDGVTDPHNLGAVLRSAAAFGARAVLTTRDRSAPLNDAAVRASAGGVAYVPVVRVTNLPRALRHLKTQGFWVAGTHVADGTPLWQAPLDGPIVVVLGAEGRGLRPGVLRACDSQLHLPLPGSVQALNVSVFAGIVCAEVARRRA